MPWSIRLGKKMLRNYGNVLVMKGKPQGCCLVLTILMDGS